MHFRNRTSKVGFLILALLLLPSAGGFHTVICHVPQHIRIQNIDDVSVYTTPETCDPETGPCNACLLNQILTQCLIPAVETIVVSRSFLLNEVHASETVVFRSLKQTVNRGPPAGISIS